MTCISFLCNLYKIHVVCKARFDMILQLVSSRIKFHRKPEAPSIPMPGQAYGYEECDDGTLKKQGAPDKDKSIGPAFYTPSSVRSTFVIPSYFFIILLTVGNGKPLYCKSESIISIFL